MTQIIVTLENDADSGFLQRVIENMKGVVRASVKSVAKDKAKPTINPHHEDWINKMLQLSDSISDTIIDYDDERTRYIMSK